MLHARLFVLTAVLALSAVGFMRLGARGGWDFVLPFRGAKLAALIVVGSSVATATVLFQTVTQNRILTPSIMGFDALYILIVTVAVFALGAQQVVAIPTPVQFAITAGALIGAALLLFGTLLGRGGHDLMRLILTGIIFGALFRSIASFLTRMIDPNEYAVIQVSSFARFNQIETDLLWIAILLSGAAMLAAWRMRHRLDVLSLGYDTAVNLGENPKGLTVQALIVISVLVAVSTALVGPVAFLGLLVVAIARQIVPGGFHAQLLPAAALVAAIALVGGQMLLERVLGLATPLSVVIDLIGGAVFLLLILRGQR